jgi:hypothetical protein
LHVKDGRHMPPLYASIFYLLEGTPPFRVTSISPKLCLSENRLELASSATCALQYVVGLAVDTEANMALLSYGVSDRTMRLAALPLDGLVELAKMHEVAPGGHETDCERTASPWREEALGM